MHKTRQTLLSQLLKFHNMITILNKSGSNQALSFNVYISLNKNLNQNKPPIYSTDSYFVTSIEGRWEVPLLYSHSFKIDKIRITLIVIVISFSCFKSCPFATSHK